MRESLDGQMLFAPASNGSYNALPHRDQLPVCVDCSNRKSVYGYVGFHWSEESEPDLVRAIKVDIYPKQR